MVSGITPSAQECKWIVYFGETRLGRPAASAASRLFAQGHIGFPIGMFHRNFRSVSES